MVTSREGRRSPAAIELRLRLARIFSKLMVLFLVAVLGYVVLPYLREVTVVVPVLNLPLVSLGAVSLLALIGVLLYRIIGDLVALNTTLSRRVKHFMKGLAMDQVGAIKRVVYDLIILIVILITFTILIPVVSKFPGIGIYLASAIPLLTLAIAVLIFWDLGKVAYSLVERFADIISDRLEEIDEAKKDKPS
ncbi:MAG: hypothetical protein LUP94_04015 [Candidatus Methanomethylicus sp.]|nr:hypothetical protein [Candidatus Methanomethylicus sp.]